MAVLMSAKDFLHTAETGDRYGTRWGRTSVMLLLGLGVIAGLLTAIKTHVIASGFTLQNATAEFATSGLDATDAGFGMTQATLANGTTVYPLRAAFANGTLDGICVSQKQTILGLPYTIMVTAGNNTLGGTYELSGKNVRLDLTQLIGGSQSGSAGNGINLDGQVQLGIASSDITTTKTNGVSDPNPLNAPTTAGYWGIQAAAAHIYNVRGTVYDMDIAGSIFLPGLSISVTQTANGCNDPVGSPRAFPK